MSILSEKITEARKSSGCRVSDLITELDSEDRQSVVDALYDQDFPPTTLSAIVSDVTGESFHRDVIRRHRQRPCEICVGRGYVSERRSES